PQAWQRLVYLYTPLILRWCRQGGLQEADAEDVGQEVFRAVSRFIAEFRHDRQVDTFRGWLRAITANKVRDFHRHNQPEFRGTGGSDAQAQLLHVPQEGQPSSAGPDDDE